MKQRAIKRCIKRARAKILRGTHKGKRYKVSLDHAGAIFVYDTCSLKISNQDIYFQSTCTKWGNWGHLHWVGNKGIVAVSYAK